MLCYVEQQTHRVLILTIILIIVLFVAGGYHLILCAYELHKYILKVMLIHLCILGDIIFVKYLNLNKLLDM